MALGSMSTPSNISSYPTETWIGPPLGQSKVRKLRGQNQQSDLLQQFITKMQTAQNSAKTANETRYSDILGGWQDLWKDTTADLNTLGNQQKDDINTTFRQSTSKGLGALISQGLYGSGQPQQYMNQAATQQSKAIQRANESTAHMKTGARQSLGSQKLAFMERRNDEYPDYSTLMNLALQLGRSGNN